MTYFFNEALCSEVTFHHLFGFFFPLALGSPFWSFSGRLSGSKVC